MAKYTYNPPYNQWSGNRSDTLNKWKVNYKGSIATASALPSKGEFKGDTYNVLEDGSNYMWNGNSWDKLDANVYVGATSSKSGIQGLVPPASSSERSKFLRGDGTYKDVTWSAITGKPSTYPPSEHTHGNISNEGKLGSTANLPLITSTNGIITTGNFGDSANTFCEGNDSRLKVVTNLYLDIDNGNDNNDGLTQSTPLATIDAALELIQNNVYRFTPTLYLYFASSSSSQNTYSVIDGIPGYKINFVFSDNKVSGIQAGPSTFIEIFGTVTTGSINAFRGGIIAIHKNANITFKDVPAHNACFSAFASGIIYTGGTVNITINLSDITITSDTAVLNSRVGGVIHFSGTETWTGSFTGNFYSVTKSSVISGIGTPSISTGSTYVIDASSSFD